MLRRNIVVHRYFLTSLWVLAVIVRWLLAQPDTDHTAFVLSVVQ